MGGIERGERNLTIKTVMKIANGLGISMSELLIAIEKDVGRSKHPSRPEADPTI